MTITESNNYKRFLNKKVRIILTPPSGATVSYTGDLLEEDDTSVILMNVRDGVLLLAKKDISQILEVSL